MLLQGSQWYSEGPRFEPKYGCTFFHPLTSIPWFNFLGFGDDDFYAFLLSMDIMWGSGVQWGNNNISTRRLYIVCDTLFEYNYDNYRSLNLMADLAIKNKGPVEKYHYPKYDLEILNPYHTCSKIWTSPFCLTLFLLNPDMSCLCKQCRSRSVGFWRSQLIWICTVCH